MKRPVFIYIWSQMSALVQLINYQSLDLFSLQLIRHTLETNSHFNLELLICVPGDLTMINLTYTSLSLDCQRPTLVVSRQVSFIYVFLVLGSTSTCIRLLPFTSCYTTSTSCCHLISKAKQTIISVFGRSHDVRLKDL